MSFFRYPGGKAKLKKIILSHIIPQGKPYIAEYREPFLGGGSIGIALLSEVIDVDKIWINDKDVGIASLWTAVINYPEEIQNFIYDFTPSVDNFYQFKEHLLQITEMPTDKNDVALIGFEKLAVHQMSYSGLGTKSGSPLGGIEQKSEYKIDCRWSPETICNKINQINYKLSFVDVHSDCCTNFSFEDVIADKTQKSVLYLDPPYYKVGNDLYQCRFSQENHKKMAEMLQDTKHDWILSYDDCDEVRALYNWANITEVSISYSIVTNVEGNKLPIKNELLILPRGDE